MVYFYLYNLYMKTKLEAIKPNVVFEDEEHKYFLEGEEIPSVTEVIKRVYPISPDAPQNLLEYGRARGTYVHSWLEDAYMETNTLDTVIDEQLINWEAKDFSFWTKLAKQGKWELDRIYKNKDLIISEVPIAHTKYKYGGTFDQLFLYGEKIVLVDFKTSSHLGDNMYNNLDKVKMQLAAYSLILKDEFGIEVDNFEVLHMTKFNTELLSVTPDYDGFLKALRLEE